MVPALALTFILVLGGQSASASSIRQSISNGQQKSSREDYNSLSCNRRDNWWMTTTKETIVERDGYGKSCYLTSDCSLLWSGLKCKSWQCVCPIDWKPNYITHRCEYTFSTGDGKVQPFPSFAIVVIVVLMVIFLGYTIVTCIKDSGSNRVDQSPWETIPYREAEVSTEQRWAEQDRSSANHLPPVGVSALTNTSSTLNLLDVQADFPPDYTDVYMQAPQEKADQLNNELPTYDEVEKQPEWHSQPVFVITPHSSGEEPGPQSVNRTPGPKS